MRILSMVMRISCVFGWHRWLYQYPHSNPPTMKDKRWCKDCGQVELAYEVWKETYYSFDCWVREEDWYKLSYLKSGSDRAPRGLRK